MSLLKLLKIVWIISTLYSSVHGWALDVQTAFLENINAQSRLSMRKEHMIDCFICISEKSVGHLCILNVLVGRSIHRKLQCCCYISGITYRMRMQQKQGEHAVFICQMTCQGNNALLRVLCVKKKWTSCFLINGISHTYSVSKKMSALCFFLFRPSIQSIFKKVTKNTHQDALLFSIYQEKKYMLCMAELRNI